jgi:hypothetical protein
MLREENIRTKEIVLLATYNLNDQIKESEMGGSCSTHRGVAECIYGFGEKNRLLGSLKSG